MGFEVLYLRRDLAHMKEQHLKLLVEQIEKAYETSEKNDINKGTYLLLKGTTHVGFSQVEQAEALFEEVLTLEKVLNQNQYQHLLCFAAYELAEISFKRSDLVKSKSYLQYTERFSGYEWEEELVNKRKLALETLNAKKSK